jgi:hypothetical protein
VDKKVVINYINSLEPAQLMFVINNANSATNDDETIHETLRTTAGDMTDLTCTRSPVDKGNDCTDTSGMQNDENCEETNHENEYANDEMDE